MGLEEKIIFHGWLPRNEINIFLKQCYLVIFPSTYPESFGIVGIEAMMNSKPVVAFNTGGVATWLSNLKNGFLVPLGNISEMRQAISRLLEDVDLYSQQSLEARAIAIKKFTPDVHMNMLIEKIANIYSIT